MKIAKIHIAIAASLIILFVFNSCSKSGSNTTPKSDDIPKPTITAVNLSQGNYNDEVIITGTNFSEDFLGNKVYFNGKEAKLTSSLKNELRALVPLSAGTGNISLDIKSIKVTGPVFTYVPAYVLFRLAGSTQIGKTDGVGESASFKNPAGLTLDKDGNIYIADTGNNLIRKVTPSGVVTTVAGTGAQGNTNGPTAIASFNGPRALVFDKAGNLYVADSGNRLLRKITNDGIVSTLAGNGLSNTIDGTGTSAGFGGLESLTIDDNGNIYVGEASIRKVTPAGNVTTVAGGFSRPGGIVIDKSGNLLVSDFNQAVIKKINPAGVVSRFAGGSTGYKDGSLTDALFSAPYAISFDKDGNLFVADGNKLRKIGADNLVSTYATNNGTLIEEFGVLSKVTFYFVSGLAFDSAGNMYIVDEATHSLKVIALK